MGSSIPLPLACTNSWEKVRSDQFISDAARRSHQSVALPDLPPSSRSQFTEEISPFHVPSTTAFSPSQRAPAMFRWLSGAVISASAVALAELPGLAEPGGADLSSMGESASPRNPRYRYR